MVTSQLLPIHHQKIHPTSPTLKGQAFSQAWKCYWNHDQFHIFVMCTTLKQTTFMLPVILVGKLQNHVVLATMTTFTTIETKHIKAYLVLATEMTLL
jgi:hypothetical protein